jgi:hypothetical protein
VEKAKMDIVLDVAFIVAVVAFLKEQFGLNGPTVLGVAFVQVLISTLTLFLGAAGSWDAARALTRKPSK